MKSYNKTSSNIQMIHKIIRLHEMLLYQEYNMRGIKYINENKLQLYKKYLNTIQTVKKVSNK